MKSVSVRWIEPIISRGKVTWPIRCQAKITTPEAVASRKRQGKSTKCADSAKVSYNGTFLCTEHAKIRALKEVMGE